MNAKALRGNRLRQVRESYGLSMEQLAARTGIHINQIYRYEHGLVDPPSALLKRLAKELQVTTDWLLGLVDQPAEHLQEQALTRDERKFLEALRQGKLRTLLSLIQQAFPDEQDQPDVAGGDVAANRQPLDSV